MKPIAILAAGLSLSLAPIAQAAVEFDWAYVGDAGNVADTTGYGAVAYDYKIATTEVNLFQYTEFLNAVAQTDIYGLYSANMGSNLNIAGISRSGVSGSYTYSVVGSGNRPVTYVSAYDAMRFVNWMHNGQGSGSTETGAYTISTGGITSVSQTGNVATVTTSGATSLSVGDQVTLSGVSNGVFNGTFVVTGVSGNTFTYTTGNSGTLSGTGGTLTGASASHLAGAGYWLPTEDEWYKAAYYDPTKGGTGGYWLYPTRSDTAPGNTIGGGTNQANFIDGDYSVTQSSSYSGSQNYLTDGGAFSNSASYYGTYDQAGNVWEWNEALTDTSRVMRGGAWDGYEFYLRSSILSYYPPAEESNFVGFRVASVPEPSAALLIMLGGAALLARRTRENTL